MTKLRNFYPLGMTLGGILLSLPPWGLLFDMPMKMYATLFQLSMLAMGVVGILIMVRRYHRCACSRRRSLEIINEIHEQAQEEMRRREEAGEV